MPRVVRALDFGLAVTGLVIALPVLVVILLVGMCDTGSPLFRQQRLGKHKKPFTLVKFRTMKRGTESVASHFASESAITSVGKVLRRTKLDELPQLWNVLKGDMSLVGPRPCLLNQQELIEARETLGVFEYVPGITGLGQVNGIDMSNPELLASTDAEMMQTFSVRRYFYYIFLTVVGKGFGDRVGAK